MSYKSRTSSRIGGTFINPDGSYRVIPDHWLYYGELMNDSTLLRLNYSSCVVEISGHKLDAILDDVAAGRLGVVTADNGDTPPSSSGLCVTSIVTLHEAAFASFERERFDA